MKTDENFEHTFLINKQSNLQHRKPSFSTFSSFSEGRSGVKQLAQSIIIHGHIRLLMKDKLQSHFFIDLLLISHFRSKTDQQLYTNEGHGRADFLSL